MLCNWQAKDGKAYSDETVPTTIASSAAGARPAFSRALRLACVAISTNDSPDRIRKRWRIPVRDAIHSSEVSIRRSRSWLDITVSGVARPVPAIIEAILLALRDSVRPAG